MADRENGRVQCFDLDGEFVKTVKPSEFGSRIFSTAYTKANGMLAQQLMLLQFITNETCRRATPRSIGS